MPSKEQDFKQRFATIMADVAASTGDTDEVLLLGSLADRIVSHAGLPDWSSFKANLSQETYRTLLASFQSQGNALAKEGAMRQMHAIEVLACSLVAKTQIHDVEVIADDRRLNRLIDDALKTYRSSLSADPIIS